MPKNSIASVIATWENVLANVKVHTGEVPNLDVYTAPLEQLLASAKEMNARLDMRRGVKQEETKERRALMLQGKKQVAKVRAALKAHFGVDSERLLEFGARPIRPRTQKNPVTAPPPTTNPPPVVPPAQEIGSGGTAPEKPDKLAGGGEEKGAPRNPTAP